MAGTEKGHRAAEQVARATGDYYGAVVDHAREINARNTGFAQRWLRNAAEELREQQRSSRELAHHMVERAEEQREAVQTLAGEALDAYMRLLYSPLTYYKQGLRLIEDNVASFPGAAADGGFPIRGYDEMNVAEISRRIDDLSAGQIQQVREYEKRNKNRDTLIEQFDRKIRNAS